MYIIIPRPIILKHNRESKAMKSVGKLNGDAKYSTNPTQHRKKETERSGKQVKSW